MNFFEAFDSVNILPDMTLFKKRGWGGVSLILKHLYQLTTMMIMLMVREETMVMSWLVGGATLASICRTSKVQSRILDVVVA